MSPVAEKATHAIQPISRDRGEFVALMAMDTISLGCACSRIEPPTEE